MELLEGGTTSYNHFNWKQKVFVVALPQHMLLQRPATHASAHEVRWMLHRRCLSWWRPSCCRRHPTNLPVATSLPGTTLPVCPAHSQDKQAKGTPFCCSRFVNRNQSRAAAADMATGWSMLATEQTCHDRLMQRGDQRESRSGGRVGRVPL